MYLSTRVYISFGFFFAFFTLGFNDSSISGCNARRSGRLSLVISTAFSRRQRLIFLCTEKEFRDIESQITKEISKKNGIVIATGGGCILREENVDALRSNGRLYFIDRDIENLTPTDSRPLATKKEAIKKLYEARYDTYIRVSDVKIDGNLTPITEANLIREEFLK